MRSASAWSRDSLRRTDRGRRHDSAAGHPHISRGRERERAGIRVDDRGRDIVQVVEHAGRKVDTTRVAARPGTMLLFDPSIGLYEMIVARARSQKSHTAAVAVVKIDAESTPMAACAVSRADHRPPNASRRGRCRKQCLARSNERLIGSRRGCERLRCVFAASAGPRFRAAAGPKR